MTRVNIVPVEELSDAHLQAEYFELPRIFNNVANAIEKGKSVSDFDIPSEYVLGTGHMTFFYDKIKYLMRRVSQLYIEAVKRGLTVGMDPNTVPLRLDLIVSPNSPWFNDYEPTEEAMVLNRSRFAERRNYHGGVYQIPRAD